MRTLKSVYRFFLHPDISFIEEGLNRRIEILLRIFLCNFIIVLLSTLPVGLLRLTFNIHPIGLSMPFINLMFINIVLIPIIEESAFRLSLVYIRINLCISVFLIFFILSSYAYSRNIFAAEGLVLRLIVSTVFGLFVFSILHYKPLEQVIIEFWKRKFNTIMYVFLFLFVIRHLDQFEYTLTTLPILLIILFPHFATGVFLSYTRVRLGFAYAIILHGVLNSFSMTILFALQ